jgi:Cu-processing system permease protein
MNEIIAIARNTFKEAIRNRVLYTILMFAIILLAFSGVAGQLTISSRDRVIKDLGFMAINLFGVAIAVFVGVTLVYNELEKKTIYTIVSKPIGRWQFLLGKYFGLLLTVWVNVLIMTLFFLISIHYNALANDVENMHGFAHNVGYGILRGLKTFFIWNAYPASSNIMPVIAITLVELMVVTAFSLLYSSFSTPTLSMFLTVFTFIAGRLNEQILHFAEQVLRNAMKAQGLQELTHVKTPAAYYIATAAAYFVPNLGAYRKVVEQALYTAGVLCLSIIVFQRRNFK